MAKIKKNPKISINEATAKSVGEIICSEIKDSRRKNSKIYKRAEASERQYNQITHFDSIGKVCNVPWHGAADYFIPLTEWIVDAIHSRVMHTLFGVEGPLMTAKGTGSEDVDRAPAITDFVDGVFREQVKIQENIDFFFKQMIKLPFAVAKYEWVNEYETMVVKDKAIQFTRDDKEEFILPDDPDRTTKAAQLIMNGYQPGPEPVEVWVSKDVEITNSAQLKYIRFDDYVWSPNTPKGQQPYWEGDRIWLTLNDMKNKAKQKKFFSSSVNYIADQIKTPSDSPLAKKVIAERSELRECYNWYGKLPFDKSNSVNFEYPDSIDQEVRAVVDIQTQRILYLGFWEYDRLPWPDRIYIRDYFEESNGFDGRSMCDKLFKTQYELNDFKNTIMNNAWISMQNIFIKKKYADSDLDDPKIYPGAIWEEITTGDIRRLNVGDVKMVGIEIENSLISFAERISNVSLYTTGTSGKGGKTKGEVDSTIYEGNIGMDRFIGRCHNVLKKICKWTGGYYYENMPEGLERRIRGESSEEIFPTQENMSIYQKKGIQPYWEADDLKGWDNFDWIWNGTSLTVDKNRNILIANDLADRYLPHPMIGGNLLAVWQIMKMGLEARGVQEWQKILPPKEAIMAEMEKMSAKAESERKLNSSGNAVDRAVKKLTEKGMPQDQAAAEVQKKMSGGANVQPVAKAQGK